MIISKSGLHKVFMAGILLEFIGLLAITAIGTKFFIAFGFMLTHIAVPLLFYGLDVYLEIVNTDESETGMVRSSFGTISGLIIAISPAVASLILDAYSFEAVYAFSGLFLIPLLYISFKYLRNLNPVFTSPEINIRHDMLLFLKDNDLRRIFETKVVLFILFTVTSIYLPIHLTQTLDFSWEQVGLIFTIIVIPFIVFGIPAGAIADKYIGEKEMIITGLLIAALSMYAIYALDVTSLILMAVLLFVSRIGASTIDFMTESYFFRRVDGGSVEYISFFRLAIPIAFIISPLIFGYFIDQSGTRIMFLLLAITMLIGIIPAIMIRDTK